MRLITIPVAKIRTIKTGLGAKIIWGMIFLTIFSSLAFLVYQLNVYTAEVYFLHNSGKELARLSQENEMMEVDLAKANSLWNIDKYAQGFEKTEKVEYIRILEDTALAK